MTSFFLRMIPPRSYSCFVLVFLTICNVAQIDSHSLYRPTNHILPPNAYIHLQAMLRWSPTLILDRRLQVTREAGFESGVSQEGVCG